MKARYEGEWTVWKSEGDTEQWVFPQVILTDQETATVVHIMTETMFPRHYYTFGGKV